jgi:hydrogenase-4 component B
MTVPALVVPALGPALGLAAWAALAAAAGLSAWRPRAGRLAGLTVCLLATPGALAWLILAPAPARLDLALPLAGLRLAVALDGLSAFFALALLPVGAAAAVAAASPARALAGLAAALAVLLAAGPGALALSVAASLLLRWPASAATRAILVLLALVAALALPNAAAEPPSAAFLLLATAAAAALAGLAALPARSADPAGEALGATIAGTAGLYLLARLLLDLAGPLVPPWWGLPPLALGIVAALRGALRALSARDLPGAIAGATQAHAGLAALGLAMAIAARAVDDAPAATLALGAALFAALALAWQRALLALVARAVAQGAGTTRLDRLGGLARTMRFTTAGALVAALGLAALPPGAGFASLWLLLQAAVLLPRGGGLDWWLFGAAVVATAAMSGAILAAAAVRIIGIAFLGRPRTPRAAAAEEVAPAWRWAMLAFCAAVLACGLLPGLVLRLADPAVRRLANASLTPQAGLLALAPGPAEPGYAAPATALLLALAALGVALLLRLRTAGPARTAPAWEGGQGPAPAWLPFGDPATQAGPAGFAQPVLRALGPMLRRIPRLRRRLPAPRLGPPGPAAAAALLLLGLLAMALGAG